MRDIVDMLLGYPMWVKVAVCAQVFCIIGLLVFFPSREKAAVGGSKPTQLRREIIEALDQKASAIDDTSNRVAMQFRRLADAIDDAAELETLNSRIQQLHLENVIAIQNGDEKLCEQLTGQIDELLRDMGNIARRQTPAAVRRVENSEHLGGGTEPIGTPEETVESWAHWISQLSYR
jgi:hypothetical protein